MQRLRMLGKRQGLREKRTEQWAEPNRTDELLASPTKRTMFAETGILHDTDTSARGRGSVGSRHRS